MTRQHVVPPVIFAVFAFSLSFYAAVNLFAVGGRSGVQDVFDWFVLSAGSISLLYIAFRLLRGEKSPMLGSTKLHWRAWLLVGLSALSVLYGVGALLAAY